MPASEAAWRGYVENGDARCAYEPAGDLYRTISIVNRPPLGQVAIVRDVQFLSAGSPTAAQPVAVAPRDIYNSDYATTNAPPSSQVGVTLTVLFTDKGQVKAHTVFTQVANEDTGQTLLRTSVNVETVRISSTAPDRAAETLSAGMVNLESQLADTSTATASLTAVAGRTATGDPGTSESGYGASRTLVAPPQSAVPVVTDTGWEPAQCSLLCWGDSRVGPASSGGDLSAEGGLPRAGSTANQLLAGVTETGPDALTFDNTGGGATYGALPIGSRQVRLVGTAPDTTALAVPSQCPLGAGSARLAGSGFISTSAHVGSEIIRDTKSCAAAQAASIGLMPTSWAPDGVIKVTLNRAYAWCSITNEVPNGDVGLNITVQVSDGHNGYLGAVSAATFDPAAVTITDRGSLSQFIQGWTFAPGSAVPETTADHVAISAAVPD